MRTVSAFVPLLLLAASLACATGRPHVVRGDEAPVHSISGGKGRARLLLHRETGAQAVSLTRLVLEPGAEVPLHVHAGSAEILLVESGEVEMSIGGEPFHARAGDAIYIPADVPHSARVTSAGPLTAVQVYSPPGPELRFRLASRVEAPPR